MGYTFCASLFKCVTKIVIQKYITLMMLRESNLSCLSVISLSYISCHDTIMAKFGIEIV